MHFVGIHFKQISSGTWRFDIQNLKHICFTTANRNERIELERQTNVKFGSSSDFKKTGFGRHRNRARQHLRNADAVCRRSRFGEVRLRVFIRKYIVDPFRYYRLSSGNDRLCHPNLPFSFVKFGENDSANGIKLVSPEALTFDPAHRRSTASKVFTFYVFVFSYFCFFFCLSRRS